MLCYRSKFSGNGITSLDRSSAAYGALRSCCWTAHGLFLLVCLWPLWLLRRAVMSLWCSILNAATQGYKLLLFLLRISTNVQGLFFKE